MLSIAIKCRMSKLILLSALLACCEYDAATQPDARTLTVDAVVDAMRADALENRGCAMGLLPAARTLTINTGDPIPPALINELEDGFVAARHGELTEHYIPQCWLGGTSVIEANPAGGGVNILPVWKLTTGTIYQTRLPIVESGRRFNGFSMVLYGDGVIDLSASVIYYAGIGSTTASLVSVADLSVSNVPATWTKYNFTMNNNVTIGADGVAVVLVDIGNGTFLRVDTLNATWIKM